MNQMTLKKYKIIYADPAWQYGSKEVVFIFCALANINLKN